jgi:hypothetical protein
MNVRFARRKLVGGGAVLLLLLGAATATTGTAAHASPEDTRVMPKAASEREQAGADRPKEDPEDPEGGGVSAAAVGCYNTSCKGQNPSTMGCGADATTLAEFTDRPFRVELRYSRACYAAWTRISSPSGTSGDSCNATFGQIRGYDIYYDTRKGVYGVQAACPGSRYTSMWPFSDGVRACVSYTWFDGEPAHCTARY